MPPPLRQPILPAPSLLTRLARENRQMGVRLAQLEFREMQAELDNPKLFDLRIDFSETSVPASPTFPSPFGQVPSQRLPVLNVPLGRIAWADTPDSLPAIGIFCPDADHDRLRRSLLDLMRAHHTRPFARLVFLCQSLRPVPFLGRYGFAYEHLASRDLAVAGSRLKARYGIVELRDLFSGSVVWRPEIDPAPETATEVADDN